MDRIVQMIVRITVQPRLLTYFSVVSTVLYASVFHPFGQRNTSFLISASGVERLAASTWIIGSRQTSIRIKQISAITRSPTLVLRDLIIPSLFFFRPAWADIFIVVILSASLPYSPLAELLRQCI